MTFRLIKLACLSVIAAVVMAPAFGQTDPSFLLTATAKNFDSYFPSYLANGYFSTMTSPRGTEPDMVYMVAFMDYACGYCRASLPGIAELIAKDPGVRVVYREFPVLGPESAVAARWALAAAEQGKYRVFHDAMFAAGQPTAQNINAAIAQAGLDRPRAEAAIKAKPIDQEIRNNHNLGAQLAMNGTPSWVIGGKLVYGARDYAGLAEAVAEARAAK